MKGGLDPSAAAAVGVVIGAVAHFGARLNSATPPTVREVLGFIMQLGVIMVAAWASVEAMGIESTSKAALVGSAFSLSAREVIDRLKRRAGGLTDTIFEPPPPRSEGGGNGPA